MTALVRSFACKWWYLHVTCSCWENQEVVIHQQKIVVLSLDFSPLWDQYIDPPRSSHSSTKNCGVEFELPRKSRPPVGPTAWPAVILYKQPSPASPSPHHLLSSTSWIPTSFSPQPSFHPTVLNFIRSLRYFIVGFSSLTYSINLEYATVLFYAIISA